MLLPLLDKITTQNPDLDATFVRNLLLVALGILRKRTTNLWKVRDALNPITGKTTVQAGSNYKRLNRFFQRYALRRFVILIVKLGVSLLGKLDIYLILDGSSWKEANGHDHYMTLCVVCGGVAVPILWLNLRRSGASSQRQRMRLFKLAFKHFDLKGKVLLADREYIGLDFFNFLIQSGLDFIIRARYTDYHALYAACGIDFDAEVARLRASRIKRKAVRRRWTHRGQTYWVVLAKKPHPHAKEDYMILLTNRDESPYQTVKHYLKRWKIETCFKHLKSVGFDLEAMRVEGRKRRNLMFAVVVLVYTLSVVEGLKTHAKKVKMKTYADGKTYPRQSVFSFGVSLLESVLLDLTAFERYLKRHFNRLLIKPPKNRACHAIRWNV